MNCRRCGQKAAINMRQHKLALCSQHFPEWIREQTERFIQKYKMFDHTHRILVAVSGGKDSLSLWDILWQLGYQADGLYIGLGIDGGLDYSHESQRMAQEFATARNLHLHIVDVGQTYGESVPMLAARTHRGQEKPCSVCGLTKRHIMNRVARDEGYDVLVTGHNLDDEAATLMGNTMNWIGGYLQRQSPVLEARSGMVRKAKPLCRFYEREMAAYALLSGIAYIYEECPYAFDTKSIYYKNLLNKMETDRPGAKLNFYLTFLQAKENGLFAATPAGDEQDEGIGVGAGGEAMHLCPTCGQPTTTPGLCTFCRMFSVKTAAPGSAPHKGSHSSEDTA